MRIDGRWDPFTAIAQVLALLSVLLTALITWWRHEPQPETPPHKFWLPTTVERPWPNERHP